MTMFRSLCLCMLLLFGKGFGSDYGDYPDYHYNEEEDKCAESPINNAYRCHRWNNCTSCKNLGSITNCRCDELCHYFGDCCSDINDDDRNSKKLDAESFQCVQRLVNSVYPHISVVMRCPKDTDEEAKKKCQENGELLVLGDKTGLTYKNKFCSYCHGEMKPSFLKTELTCNVEPALNTKSLLLYNVIEDVVYFSKYDGMKCRFAYEAVNVLGDVPFHYCTPGVVSTCPQDASPDLVMKCRGSVTDFVYELNGIKSSPPPYKNKWCAQCNGISRTDCTPALTQDPPPPVRAFDSLVDLSFLTCISTDSLTADQVDTCKQPTTTCPEGTKYKPLVGCVSAGASRSKPEHLSRCPKWVNSSEYDINGDKITLTAHDVMSSEYYLEGDQAYVCVYNNEVKAHVILGIVLIILSLLCILLQLAFYCYFKQLRNVPGFIVMCIISCLFVALLTFLISINTEYYASPQACVALGVIQHLAFLASFFWTNVMAFDVTRMLSATLKTHGKKRLIWYNIYAWLLPVVLVTVSLLAEYYQMEINPEYGTQTCWINNPFGLLAFFVGPLFSLILLNVILYIIAVASIARAARQTRMVNPGLKERLFLCIKLIIVMGLPWVFALVRAFTDNIVVSYIFIILTTSQGIAIFICFIMTKTVLNLIKGRRIDRMAASNSTTRTNFGISLKNRTNKSSLSSDNQDNQLKQTLSNDSHVYNH